MQLNCNLDNIISTYNYIIETISETCIGPYFVSDKFPTFLNDFIADLVLDKDQETNDLNKIIVRLNKLVDSNCNLNTINYILATLFTKPQSNKYLLFNKDELNTEQIDDSVISTVEFVNRLYNELNRKQLGLRFLRFVILNLITSFYPQSYISIIYFKFKKQNETQITTFILKNYDFEFKEYLIDYDDIELLDLELVYLELLENREFLSDIGRLY